MADNIQQGKAIQQNDGLEELLNTDSKWLVRWASLLKVIKAIIAGRLIQGRNIELRQLGNGIQINALGEGAEPSPWDATLSGTAVTINPGYLNGIAPTIGGDPIDDDPAPTLAISLTGTQVVYLELQMMLTAANDFVYKAEFYSAIIDVASSLPSNDSAAGTYYLRLATYVDGVKQTPQPVLTNQIYWIYDTLDGTSSANCQFDDA